VTALRSPSTGVALLLLCSAVLPSVSHAATERDAAALYKDYCAACHEGGVPRAPHSVKFQMLGAASILRSMESGVMQTQAAALSPTERRSLANFLGGSIASPDAQLRAPQCSGASAEFDASRPPTLAGWGMTPENTRHVDARTARLRERDVPRLAVKWSFAFPGATRARSQPTVGGGALYVGSQDGTVYALDLDTGCVRWSFAAEAEVRTSPVLEPWRRGDRNARPRLWIADFNGNAYALDARSGQQLWKSRVDAHPRLTITGSPRYHDGRLYVPMSSTEWAAAADPAYECCTFRGGVAALDATSGALVWRSYTIPEEPRLTGELNSAGAARRHPSGAPVWNSPTIDAKRRRLYVGTGEAYTSPAAAQSDAVIAYDLDTGRMLWWHQSLPGDAWNMACFIGGGPNCPVENGPDLDIGAPRTRPRCSRQTPTPPSSAPSRACPSPACSHSIPRRARSAGSRPRRMSAPPSCARLATRASRRRRPRYPASCSSPASMAGCARTPRATARCCGASTRCGSSSRSPARRPAAVRSRAPARSSPMAT
jgi:polyvinyl alcohol dehydrogenase (cytochrome)